MDLVAVFPLARHSATRFFQIAEVSDIKRAIFAQPTAVREERGSCTGYGLAAARRRVESIPRGLAALLAKLWQRIAADSLAGRGLGILCAAREALALDEIGAVAGWTDEAQWQAFLRGASELLVESRRADDVPECANASRSSPSTNTPSDT